MDEFKWPGELRVGVLTPPKAVDPVGMVIREGLISLQTVVEEIDALEALRPNQEVDRRARGDGNGGSIVSDPGIYVHTKNICDGFGLASTALFERKQLESNAARQARSAKLRAVDEKCEGIDVAIFTDRRTRNRMVHCDEWIPQLSRQYPESFWITGIGFTHRGMISSPELKFIYNRVFLFEEGLILHLETELDVRALRAAAVRVLEALS